MIRKKKRVPTLAIIILYSFGSASHGTQEGKEIKRIQIVKQVKLLLIACDMMLYIQNTKDATLKLPELINGFSNFLRYKIKTQKSFAFLYNNNQKSEREIKESTPLTIATKRVKYLGINVPKETKDLYSENYKILMK